MAGYVDMHGLYLWKDDSQRILVTIGTIATRFDSTVVILEPWIAPSYVVSPPDGYFSDPVTSVLRASYAGRMPVSFDVKDTTEALFFWYFPSQQPSDKLVRVGSTDD